MFANLKIIPKVLTKNWVLGFQFRESQPEPSTVLVPILPTLLRIYATPRFAKTSVDVAYNAILIARCWWWWGGGCKYQPIRQVHIMLHDTQVTDKGMFNITDLKFMFFRCKRSPPYRQTVYQRLLSGKFVTMEALTVI